MTQYLGDFAEDASVYIPFNTFSSDDPSASVTITNLADADIKVHKDGSTTQIATDGATVAINFDGITGNHLITIDTSVHADYSTGSDYLVRIEGTTVDGATINAWVGTFSIENRYMRGTDSAYTGTPPTAAAIRSEIDSNSTQLAAIVADTSDIGTNGAGLTAIPWNSSWDAEVQSEVTDALNAYDPPTKTELDSGFAALNDPTAASIAGAVWDESTSGHTTSGTFGEQVKTDIDAILVDTNDLQTSQGDWVTATGFSTHSAADVWTSGARTLTASTNFNDLSAADVNAQVDAALADIHLDHLFATDYDPASKPGTATALLNELIESDAGVSRFTANALEQGPSGGGGGGDATLANQTTIIGHLTDMKGGGWTSTDTLENIYNDTAVIGAAGAGLTNIPWNSSWDAEVQSECADALAAYDPPTKAEMDSAFTEIKGATWASGTDTLEAIRNRGDAAWITGSGGDATESNQTAIIGHLTDIKGASWDSTNSLEAIHDDVQTVDGVVDGIQTDLSNGTDGLGAIKTAVDAVPTAAQNRSEMDSNSTQLAAIVADTNELQSDDIPGTLSTIEGKIDTVDGVVDAILVDTGTTIPGLITNLQGATVTKNAAFSNFEFVMKLSSDHYTAATGKTVTGERSIDGGAFASVSGSIAEVSDGAYQFDALAADTNGDLVTWKFSAVDCDDTFVTFKTSS